MMCLQQAAAKPQGSQPQPVSPCCGDGGGWRGEVEEESVARVVESTGCQVCLVPLTVLVQLTIYPTNAGSH